MEGVAFDMESVNDEVIGLGAGDDQVRGYAVGDESTIELLNQFPYLSSDTPRIAHSAQADLRALGAVNEPAFYPLFDTIIAAHLVGEESGYLGLSDLSRQVLSISLEDFSSITKRFKAKDLAGVPEAEVAKYNLKQVKSTYLLWKHYSKKINSDPRLQKLFELELKVLPVLANMEEAGILVDRARLVGLGKKWTLEAKDLQESVTFLTNAHIQNVNSPKQVQEYLFGKLPGQLHLRPAYFSKGTKKPSANERSLKKIISREGDSVKWLKILLRTRQVQKNVGTYCVGIVSSLDYTSRSHSHLSQVTTDTGRLASKNPNHQNIPKRRDYGLDVRRCFIAPEGHTLIACDMDQLELRILAEEAQEPKMRAAFLAKEDIHLKTAIELFDGAKDRFKAKVLNYTIVYLAGPEQIGDQIGESKAVAEMKQAKYFRVYSRLKEWIREWDEICKEKGYTETWLGRRRDVSVFYNDPRKTYKNGGSNKGESWITEGTRKAVNTRIQGTAAEIMKLAMLRIDVRLREAKLNSRMLMQVHDEILMEVPLEEKDCAEQILREEMTVMYKTMPLPCTVKSGPNWADVK